MHIGGRVMPLIHNGGVFCRHEMQRCTNQIAKDTGTYVKDLNQLSASWHSVEPVSKMTVLSHLGSLTAAADCCISTLND